ncbi:hypothetical protein CLLI_20090 [Clostridium liquoris]|uniref:Uncharacterized protein n=1 Tax=Clostridium liquoris TaxID=1289519 RepID=A0A2T0B2H4_9CLOT|nr:hypothetical protein [Clostridium liquoris]PRR78089.1 hypothetical protein CLLI_20090 [Clostridium liquoris]
MFLFDKRVDEKIINEISEIIDTYPEEMEECFLPNDAKMIWYLGGNEDLDAKLKNELENFDLHKLFDPKKTTLSQCLREHIKVRKSFFFALNNIKQGQNIYYNTALLDFLKQKGKMFIDNYLAGFQKSANHYYKKKISKGKVPEYRDLFAWIQDDELYLLDKLFVYFGTYKIPLDNIICYYENDDIARTVLEYVENGENKSMTFNLGSYGIIKEIIPFKAKEIVT